jgi:predicted nucleotide-binding protein
MKFCWRSYNERLVSRGSGTHTPCDNTIFELGLFMGKLERRRTFIVKEQNTDVKIPTDLLGVTPLTYIYSGGSNLSAVIKPDGHEGPSRCP